MHMSVTHVAFPTAASRSIEQRGAPIDTVKTQGCYVFQECDVRSRVELTRRVGERLLRG
jgi:hypothetical protein